MRHVEPIRITDLVRQVPGKWVAIRAHEIVEVADSLDHLMNALTVRCIEPSSVTVMRSPVESETELVGFG